MTAEVNNIENINHFAEPVSHVAEPVTYQRIPKLAHSMNGEAYLNTLKNKTIFTSDLRAQFYSCTDRTMLPSDQLHRIYELEKLNDQLHRIIFHKENSINTTKDPLMVLADIEHAKMTIARNAGEILKFFDLTALRVNRIAELEKENEIMHQENQERQAIWTTLHDMKERSQIAGELFLNKDLIAKNEAEIIELRQSLAC